MTDLATLKLAVDSRPVVEGIKDLKAFESGAGSAERAVDKLGKTAAASFAALSNSSRAQNTNNNLRAIHLASQQATQGVVQGLGNSRAASRALSDEMGRLRTTTLGTGAAGKSLVGEFLKANLISDVIHRSVGAMSDFAQEIARTEREAQKLRGVLAVTGGASGRSLSQIEAGIQRTGDLRTGPQAAANLLTVPFLSGTNFDRALSEAGRLAQIFGTTESASQALGAALRSQGADLKALGDAGIHLTAAQVETIRKFRETGDAASAIGGVLSGVEQRTIALKNATDQPGLAGAYARLDQARANLVRGWFEQTEQSHKLTTAMDFLRSVFEKLGGVKVGENTSLNALDEQVKKILADAKAAAGAIDELGKLNAKGQQVIAGAKAALLKDDQAEQIINEIKLQTELNRLTQRELEIRRQQIRAGVAPDSPRGREIAGLAGAAYDALMQRQTGRQLETERRNAQDKVKDLQAGNALLQAQLSGNKQLSDELEVQARLRSEISDRAAAANPALAKAIELEIRRTREMQEQLRRIGLFTDSIASNMERAFSDFIETGKFSFKSFADSVIKDIMRIYFRLEVIEPLMRSLTGALSGAGAGGGSGLFGSLLGGLLGGGGGGLSNFNAGVPAEALGTGGVTTNLGYFASGGPVHGPGTRTSDSVLARLSDGEYVVNAHSAARHRRLLEAINNAPRFAAGGWNGAPPPSNDQPVINNTYIQNSVPNAEVKQRREEKNATGGRDIYLEFSERFAADMMTPGTHPNRALERMGARVPTRRT